MGWVVGGASGGVGWDRMRWVQWCGAGAGWGGLRAQGGWGMKQHSAVGQRHVNRGSVQRRLRLLLNPATHKEQGAAAEQQGEQKSQAQPPFYK